ncbi:MAG: fibronectin type III domain-containing protein [Spirochaetaceae bacterium]|nr:MAG: fibronectin type III domain-containing protein [Spirochaetaceae bacterium]
MPASPTLTSPSNGASNLNPAGVTLRWSESSNAASYSVFYRIDGSPVWTEIKDISTNEYTVTGLAEGETYRWFVRALRGDNYADSSSSRVFSTLVSVKAPDAPSNMTLTLSTVGSGLNERMRVSSTWIDNSSNEDGFHISARAVGQSWPSHDVLPVNTTSYTVDVHPPPRGTQIEARVRSFNTGGVSTWIYSPIVTY